VSNGFKFGGVTFPIAAQTAGTPLLESCDPGLSAILQYLRATITAYVGDALVGAASNRTEITVAVGDVLNIDPERIKAHTTYKFPLLCAWRLGSRNKERTKTWRQKIARVRVAYVLPPLDADALVNINPILNAVENVADNVLFQAVDANYLAGATVFTDNGISDCNVISTDRGVYKLGDQLDFDATVIDLEMTERAQEYSALDPDFDGTDVEIANATDPTSIVPHQIDMLDGTT
jgi:hypothetical protein